MGRMGDTKPLIRGEKKAGAENISGERAPSGRPARQRRLYDMDQPVSLEKLVGHASSPAHSKADCRVSGPRFQPVRLLQVLKR